MQEDRVMSVSLYLYGRVLARILLNWSMLWTDQCSEDYGPTMWATKDWPFDVFMYKHLCLTIFDVASGLQLCSLTPAEAVIDYMEDEEYFSFDSDIVKSHPYEGIFLHLSKSGRIGVGWEEDGAYVNKNEFERIAANFLRKRLFL